MTALRLSIFALGCVAFSGFSNFFAVFALLLAVLVLHGFAKCNRILLNYCHVGAGVLWIVSFGFFIANSAPIVLLVFLFVMFCLDGIFEPIYRKKYELD